MRTYSLPDDREAEEVGHVLQRRSHLPTPEVEHVSLRPPSVNERRQACMYFCQSSVLCIIINSHKSLSTSQLTRDWTVITYVSGSIRNPRCSHLYIEPKLLSRGLSMALDGYLKAERSTPFGPYKILQLPKNT